MGHGIVLLIAALIFSAPQEQVRVTLRGGGAVEGSLLGFENGKYRIQTADGVRDIDVKDVVSIASKSKTPPPAPAENPPAPASNPPAPAEGAGALKDIDDLHARLTGQQSETEAALRTTLTRSLSGALADRKASDAAGILRRIALWLPEPDALSAFKRIAEAIDGESAARPADAFAGDLALGFASEVARNPKFTQAQRARAFQLLFTVSDRLRERKLYREETAYLTRASDLFPEGRAIIADRLTRARLDLAQALLVAGDLDGAAREARAVLAAIPSQPLAQEILQKATPPPPPPPPAAAARAQVPPGVDILEDEEENEAAIHPDLARFFPHAKGLSYAYRRRDGTQISIFYDAAVKEGDAVKIDYTLEEKSGDEKASHKFQQFLAGSEVYRESYGRKETLLRVPARAGDSWTWAVGDATYTRRIAAVNAAVKVGSKAYNGCVRVEFVTRVATGGRAVTVTTDSYYAPGVGLVRLDFLEEPYQKYGLELVDFSAARP